MLRSCSQADSGSAVDDPGVGNADDFGSFGALGAAAGYSARDVSRRRH